MLASGASYLARSQGGDKRFGLGVVLGLGLKQRIGIGPHGLPRHLTLCEDEASARQPKRASGASYMARSRKPKKSSKL